MKALLYQLDATSRKLVLGVMEERGHLPITANSREEALETIESERIDLILTDVQRDGCELVRSIRAKENGTRVHVPVIALAVRNTPGNRQRWSEVGADALLSIPVEASELLTLLERLDGHAALDVVAALERVEGDRVLLEELFRLFVDECHNSMGQIQEAWRSRDTLMLGRLAHTLKGSSANVGANRVSDVALALEREARSGNLDNAPKLIADLKREVERVIPELDSVLRQAAR